MEKLLNLLNEYEKEVKKSDKVWSIDNDGDICRKTYEGVDYNEYTEYMNTNNLISKSFLFIKWLVENDKIKPLRKFIGWETDEDEPYIQFDLVDQYIAYLSIQDNPIEFLISILK